MKGTQPTKILSHSHTVLPVNHDYHTPLPEKIWKTYPHSPTPRKSILPRATRRPHLLSIAKSAQDANQNIYPQIYIAEDVWWEMSAITLKLRLIRANTPSLLRNLVIAKICSGVNHSNITSPTYIDTWHTVLTILPPQDKRKLILGPWSSGSTHGVCYFFIPLSKTFNKSFLTNIFLSVSPSLFFL